MVGWGSMCILPNSLSAASWLTVRHLSIRDWSWVRSFYKKNKKKTFVYIRITNRCWQYESLVSNHKTTLSAWDFPCAVSGFCQVLIVTRARGFGLRPTPKIPDACQRKPLVSRYHTTLSSHLRSPGISLFEKLWIWRTSLNFTFYFPLGSQLAGSFYMCGLQLFIYFLFRYRFFSFLCSMLENIRAKKEWISCMTRGKTLSSRRPLL